MDPDFYFIFLHSILGYMYAEIVLPTLSYKIVAQIGCYAWNDFDPCVLAILSLWTRRLVSRIQPIQCHGIKTLRANSMRIPYYL